MWNDNGCAQAHVSEKPFNFYLFASTLLYVLEQTRVCWKRWNTVASAHLLHCSRGGCTIFSALLHFAGNDSKLSLTRHGMDCLRWRKNWTVSTLVRASKMTKYYHFVYMRTLSSMNDFLQWAKTKHHSCPGTFSLMSRGNFAMQDTFGSWWSPTMTF